MPSSAHLNSALIDPPTQWSMIAGLEPGQDGRRESLERLSASYFYPVYAFVRDRGLEAAQAYSYSHGFFGWLLPTMDQDAPQVRFRIFLLQSLHRFLEQPRHAQSPLAGAPSQSHVERRYELDPVLPDSPEQGFDLRFAREVMTRALSRLKAEATENGRQELFEALAPYLIQDPDRDQKTALRESLNMSTLAFSVALKRLRARYIELGNAELTQTMLDPDELSSERTVMYTLFDQRK